MKPERIDVRVTREEKMAWFKAANLEGMKLGDWIRKRINNSVFALEGDKMPVNISFNGKNYKPRYFDVP